MNYPGYFLIVWDFIKYARDHGIPVGPGRGSATGSLVAYAMEITNVDPLQNSLLFERFLNPERVSMPDIDVDFCQNRRGEVIEYVTRKYGREQVAQIITFNTMAAKAAIKDCGRALDMPYGDVDRIAKLIPTTVGVTLEEATERSAGIAARLYDNDQVIRELMDTAKKLEGLVRGAGVHASAVVIAPRPLTELVPLNKTKNDEIVTAYDMKAVEKMGLLKMDFLGLATLTVINDCLKLIEQSREEKLDIDMVPLDDEETFKRVFHTALTSGVFQFESSRDAGHFAALQTGHGGGVDGAECAFPAGADGDDRRLYRAQVGAAQGGVSAAGAGRDSEGLAGGDRLPGTGDADFANCWRATRWARRTCCGGRWAKRASEGDGRAARPLYERSGGAGASEGGGGGDLRPDGEVLGVRIQQVALCGVCAGGLPDGLFEDALSGGVYGGAADDRKHRSRTAW